MKLHSLANVVGQAEEQQVKTLEFAAASAKEINDSGAKGMVLSIATDPAKRGELERAKRAIGPIINTGDRVAALQTLARRLGAAGKREESLQVIGESGRNWKSSETRVERHRTRRHRHRGTKGLEGSAFVATQEHACDRSRDLRS